MMMPCIGCGELVDRFHKLKTPRCFTCKAKRRYIPKPKVRTQHKRGPIETANVYRRDLLNERRKPVDN